MRSSQRASPTLVLGIGAVLNGALAYAFFAISARALGVQETGPLSVLWAYWGIAGAAITFPIQHWIVRTTLIEGEGRVASSMRRLGGSVAALSLLVALLSVPVRSVLFFDTSLVFPLLIGLVTLGSALTGVARGGLAARGRIRELAGMMVLENAIRVAAALLLVFLGADDPALFGGALVIGHVAGLAFPSALRFRGRRPCQATLALRGVGAASAGQLMAQFALTGPPIVLAAMGGSAAETALLFAVLALYRAPYTVGLGLAPQLTRWWSLRVATGDLSGPLRPDVAIGVATGVAALTAVALGYSVGPTLVALVFGRGFDVSTQVSVLIAFGSAIALGNLATTVALISTGSALAISRSWAVALPVATVAGAVVPATGIDRVSVGFAVAETVALLLLLIQLARDETHRPAYDSLEVEGGSPGSVR